MKKYKLIEHLCENMLDKNSEIDLHAYGRGLNDMYETLSANIDKWVPISDILPSVNIEDKWDKDLKISKYVLTFSSKWGMRFGRYNHLAEFWSVEGVSSSNGVEVDYWMEIKPPIL